MSPSTVHGVAVARRPVTGADTPLLRELFADARIELAVLPPDTRFVLVDMRFRAQRRQHATQFPKARNEIIVVDGVDVGSVLVDRRADGLRIVDITVSLGHRREGIASAVLRELRSEADAAGLRVWLTYWTGNTAMAAMSAGLAMTKVAEADGYVTVERRPSAG